MRNYATFLAILIVTVPTLALAQTPTPAVPGSSEPSPTAVPSADANNSQNPAVILKPIRPDSKFDMALIDDVCVHTKRQRPGLPIEERCSGRSCRLDQSMVEIETESERCQGQRFHLQCTRDYCPRNRYQLIDRFGRRRF